MSEPDRWVTMDDAAAEISVSRKTIRRMITRGEIEAKRFGPRLVRVNISSLIRSGRDLQWRDPNG